MLNRRNRSKLNEVNTPLLTQLRSKRVPISVNNAFLPRVQSLIYQLFMNKNKI